MSDKYKNLKVGDEIRVAIFGTVVEVGESYAVIETDAGYELDVNDDWDLIE